MSSSSHVYDLVGLGFGPANIAIAAALTENWQRDSNFPVKNALFIEKHEVFRWHPGMLLPDAKMQISFLKDLATLRSPNSPYTFLAYLHDQDRLLSYINRGSTIPTRKEYADYLSWAAAKVQDNGVQVKFGHEIFALDDGPDGTIQVRYRNLQTKEESTLLTRDLIISPGGTPRTPDFLQPFVSHPRVLHSSSYALRIGDILDSLQSLQRPLRVAVVGSGQSAAEVTMDVRNRLASIPTNGRHTVEMLIRKGSLKPSDDSPFANEIFDPASTDAWFSTGSKRVRDNILAEYKQTNYGVVNPRTLDIMYEIIYDQRLNQAVSRRKNIAEPSDPLIDIKPYTSITSIQLAGQQQEAELLLSPEGKTVDEPERPFLFTTQHMLSGVVSQASYDIVLYATGYQRTAWVDLFKNTGIAKHFGLSSATSRVTLRPSADLDQDEFIDSFSTSSPISDSASSTPQTSPETSAFSSPRAGPVSQDLYMSRRYQLLPTVEGSLAARVYLQGVEETTHGLSDTLLSVLGVRAGEVMEDLSSRYK